jgi:hypothetical protein
MFVCCLCEGRIANAVDSRRVIYASLSTVLPDAYSNAYGAHAVRLKAYCRSWLNAKIMDFELRQYRSDFCRECSNGQR